MEVVPALILAAATALLVGRLGGNLPEAVFGAFSRLVAGYPVDGWPRGVQEEDRDRPWGHAARIVGRSNAPSIPKPTLTRVRPTVHPR